MNWKTIKAGISVVTSIATIAVTIYETKKMVKEVKKNIDESIEQQVQEQTGDSTFNLAEYRKNKEAQNGNKKKSNVKVTVNVDGVPLKKYASLKLIKYLVGLFGLSALFFFGLHKIKSTSFVTGLLSRNKMVGGLA
jgi:hypothetical protein